MTLNMKWKCGIGYGDFVSGLCAAHTYSVKSEMPVHIVFYWNHSKDFLYSPLDPEPITYRCDYIFRCMKKIDGVSIDHVFNADVPFRTYNNLDEKNPLHNKWYLGLSSNTKPKHVALWTTEHNTYYPGIIKDPIGKNWDLIRKKLDGYKIEEITYRTPVNEVVDIINRCEFGIGYDGSVHQLFNFVWKPIFIFCRRLVLNEYLVPQSITFTGTSKFLKMDLGEMIDAAHKKVEAVQMKYDEYLNEKINPEDCFTYNLHSNYSFT